MIWLRGYRRRRRQTDVRTQRRRRKLVTRTQRRLRQTNIRTPTGWTIWTIWKIRDDVVAVTLRQIHKRFRNQRQLVAPDVDVEPHRHRFIDAEVYLRPAAICRKREARCSQRVHELLCVNCILRWLCHQLTSPVEHLHDGCAGGIVTPVENNFPTATTSPFAPEQI